MNPHHFIRFRHPLLVLAFLVLSSIACGQSSTKELTQAATPGSLAVLAPTATSSQDTAQIIIAQPTVASLAVEQPTVSESAVQQATAALVATPMPASTPLTLFNQGFGQDGRSVGYAFFVRNENQGVAIENSRYQVAFFASDGTVVDTDSGYIELVLPGQTLGIGGSTFLDEGVTPSRIEVQISTGDSVLTDAIPTFTMEMVEYQAGSYSSYAVGVIHSPFSKNISNLRVSAVAFDSANNIVGGGFTYANFITANGSRGVKVSMTSPPNVSRVEIYPTVSNLTFFTSRDVLPDETAPLSMLRQGYGQDDDRLAYGIVVQNPNGNYSIEDSEYIITAFSGDGRVLSVEEGYINLVLPGQTLGIADSSYLPNAGTVARMEVQIQTDDLVPSEQLPIFTAENISYQPGDYSSSVTGQIVNPYPHDITQLKVAAVLYDGAGNIIGGGYTYLDFVPATGRAAVDVSVTSSGLPTGAELYASVSNLSEIK